LTKAELRLSFVEIIGFARFAIPLRRGGYHEYLRHNDIPDLLDRYFRLSVGSQGHLRRAAFGAASATESFYIDLMPLCAPLNWAVAWFSMPQVTDWALCNEGLPHLCNCHRTCVVHRPQNVRRPVFCGLQSDDLSNPAPRALGCRGKLPGLPRAPRSLEAPSESWYRAAGEAERVMRSSRPGRCQTRNCSRNKIGFGRLDLRWVSQTDRRRRPHCRVTTRTVLKLANTTRRRPDHGATVGPNVVHMFQQE
jgi:hypothetical protein